MYTAKLTVDGKSFSQSFEIQMDPRVSKQGFTKAAIVSQIAFQQQVIDLLSEARKLQAQLEKNKSNKAKVALKKLKNNSGIYPQQMLVSQISYLLYMVSSADQEPGQEATERFKELTTQLNAIKQEVK
jgi:hypothetical protein